jgi:drug/metabolite transporter (DMT)-like permease
MGSLYCLLALVSFGTFYLLLGGTKGRNSDPIGVNLAAFGTGGVLSILAAAPANPLRAPSMVFGIGTAIGASAVAGLVGITFALRAGAPLSVVNTAISLSMVLPILLSFVLYGEVPRPLQLAGLALALISIVLIQWQAAGGRGE